MAKKENILTRFLDALEETFEEQPAPLISAPEGFRDIVEMTIAKTESYLRELRDGHQRTREKETHLELIWLDVGSKTAGFDEELAQQCEELALCFRWPGLDIDDLEALVPTYFEVIRESFEFLGLEES